MLWVSLPLRRVLVALMMLSWMLWIENIDYAHTQDVYIIYSAALKDGGRFVCSGC